MFYSNIQPILVNSKFIWLIQVISLILWAGFNMMTWDDACVNKSNPYMYELTKYEHYLVILQNQEKHSKIWQWFLAPEAVLESIFVKFGAESEALTLVSTIIRQAVVGVNCGLHASNKRIATSKRQLPDDQIEANRCKHPMEVHFHDNGGQS